MSGLKRIKARVKKPGVRAYRVGQLVDVLKFGEKGFVDFPKNYSTGRVIKITTRLHVTFNGPGHMAYDASDCNQGRIRAHGTSSTEEVLKPLDRIDGKTEFAVSFTRTISMHYSTEVWARDEAEAIELAKEEADNSRWNEGHLVDEEKPKVRRIR